jgi:6-phosphogluconate dehydrogenase
MVMVVGLIGLGRMGRSIAERLIKGHYTVVGFDPAVAPVSLGALFTHVDHPLQVVEKARIIWLMVPAGSIIDELLENLYEHLRVGDIIIDGGNSHFNDTVRRAQWLKERGVSLVDCGTSGGIHGKEQGFSLMIGGDKNIFLMLEPLFKCLATPQGYAYLGSAGAGHYVKMVHNGIEYALMEAYAEGFAVLKEGSYGNELDLAQVSAVWSQGSVIRSWLLTLLHAILHHDQKLNGISGKVDESGTGAWTVAEAERYGIPITLIEDAVRIRAESRRTGGTYATKLVALLRQQFGGHTVHREDT